MSEFQSRTCMQTHWDVLLLDIFSRVRFLFIANRRSKLFSPPYSLSEVKQCGLDSCQGKALRASCRSSWRSGPGLCKGRSLGCAEGSHPRTPSSWYHYFPPRSPHSQDPKRNKRGGKGKKDKKEKATSSETSANLMGKEILWASERSVEWDSKNRTQALRNQCLSLKRGQWGTAKLHTEPGLLTRSPLWAASEHE